MVENFERVLKKEWYREDLKTLTSQIKEQESLLRLKRRWLMDLPLSMTEQKRVEEMLPVSDKILPESLLREDDVSYEDIRTCIEIGFGSHSHEKEPHFIREDVKLFNPRESFGDILFLLDDMTNKGLYTFLKILADGTIKFEKTNWIMKRTIRELLPKVIADKNGISKTKIKQLSQLLKDPKNFHGNHMPTSIIPSKAYRAEAFKLLDALKYFPSRTLTAMHRKLKGVTGYIPSVATTRCRSKRELIDVIRNMCRKMLSDIGEVDEPAGRLAGALGVASLQLKLLRKCPEIRDFGKFSSEVEALHFLDFRKFSPEVEALQNDIAKAIKNTKKVRMIELRKLQLLPDPNYKLSVRSLRTGVRNLLTEFLYECSDMEYIPDYLVETLEIINRKSRKKYSSSKSSSCPQELMKKELQKEVECVLTISSQAKEVVLDLLPEHEFDEEFAHAYMEDFEGSDISVDDVEDNSPSYDCSNNSCSEAESIGETNLVEVNSSPLSPKGGLNIPLESLHITKMDLDEICAFPDLSSLSHSPARISSQKIPKSEERNNMSQQAMSGNQYFDVQEACDVTSMIAYRFVGHILDKLAKMDDLELCQGDRLYLRHYSSAPEDSEENPQTLSTSELVGIWKNVL